MNCFFDFSYISKETDKEKDDLLKNSKRHNEDVKNLSNVERELLIATQTDELIRVSKGLASLQKASLE